MQALASGFWHITAIAFGVLAYLWAFVGFVIGDKIADRLLPGRDHAIHSRFAGWFMIVGAVAMYLAWEFLLPDWWKAMTPLFTPAISD